MAWPPGTRGRRQLGALRPRPGDGSARKVVLYKGWVLVNRSGYGLHDEEYLIIRASHLCTSRDLIQN